MNLGEKKMEKAYLRNVMDNQLKVLGYIRWQTGRKYCELLTVLKRAESKILKPISICLVLLFLGGCHTASGFGDLLKGAGTDVKNVSEGYLAENR
jgi:predicted small secreted protein